MLFVLLAVFVIPDANSLDFRNTDKILSARKPSNMWQNVSSGWNGMFRTFVSQLWKPIVPAHGKLRHPNNKRSPIKQGKRKTGLAHETRNLTIYEEIMHREEGGGSRMMRVAEGRPIESESNELMPYLVSLRSWTDEHLCGGSVVNRMWVLSAAHCWVERFGFKIAAASVYRVSHRSIRYFEVDRMILHEMYRYPATHHDIALLMMTRPFEYHQSIQPVQFGVLPEGYPRDILVAGWGYESLPGQTNKQNRGRIVLGYSRLITGGICAYRDKFCSESKLSMGDSGGPLMCEGKQVGVVSISILDENDASTNLSVYYTWMKRVMLAHVKGYASKNAKNIRLSPK